MTDLPLVRELIPVPDPSACCEQLAGLSHRLWLDSTSDADRLGRYSFLSADPCVLVEATGTEVNRIMMPGGIREALGGDALGALRDLMAPFRSAPLPGLPPFQGGAAGYIGYEFGGTLERLPDPPANGIGVPD